MLPGRAPWADPEPGRHWSVGLARWLGIVRDFLFIVLVMTVLVMAGRVVRAVEEPVAPVEPGLTCPTPAVSETGLYCP